MSKLSTLTILIISFISLLTFSQCKSTKVGLQEKTPFTIVNSFYQEWIGGIPNVSGATVQITVDNTEAKATPLYVYFKDSKAKVSDQGSLWVGNFSNKKEKDINMSSDPKEEFGNTPPQIEKLPFKITQDEAVISYTYKGKINYFKLTHLTKKETISYPATNPNH